MTETAEGPGAVVALDESPDVAGAPDLLAAARAALGTGRGVLVDCSGPPFLATWAVQILHALRRACRDHGLPFAATGVRESAAAHLRRAGLDAVLRP